MTKTEKILAAYERFGAAIAGVSDPAAQSLWRTSEDARGLIAEARARAPQITTSALNAGLEQELRKVLARGKIRSAAEFYRVRYEIDVVEGERSRASELKVLYALVDAYEARP